MFGQFEVSLQAVMQYPEYTLREFKMVDTEASQTMKTSQQQQKQLKLSNAYIVHMYQLCHAAT